MKLFKTHTLIFRCTVHNIIVFAPQSIPIDTNLSISIGIDNRYQSITTRIFAIDWSSIININRLIDIDWYRLISIVINYRFHRLDTPGIMGLPSANRYLVGQRIGRPGYSARYGHSNIQNSAKSHRGHSLRMRTS